VDENEEGREQQKIEITSTTTEMMWEKNGRFVR
jgi:hypothetical protein